MGIASIRRVLALSCAIRAVLADGGTLIPIATYTDSDCRVPSTISPNVSIGLDVCAVTPGLGSISLHQISCASGVVKAYGFTDTSCGNPSNFADGGLCKEHLGAGAFAAMQLSCGQESADVPVGTTTITVGTIATNGAKTNTAAAGSTASVTGSSSSSNTGASSGSSTSSSSTGTSSGWNSLSSGAKTGIIVGAIALVALLLLLSGLSRRHEMSNWVTARRRNVLPGPNPIGGYPMGNALSSKPGVLSNVTELGNRDAESARAWMERLKNEVHPIFFPRELNVPPVRVAILDTGANFDDRTSRYLYDNRIVDYWSWCATPNSAQGKSMFSGRNRNILPEGRDLDGHGTHVMSVLLEVAPFCEVYIAKVFEGRNDMKDDVSSANTAQRVSNAIVHAVQHWQVDMISMSFGFGQEIEAISRAINYATDGSRPMLVFAAASNTGGNDHVQWPASHDRVICIHATDGDGNKYGLNPTPENKPHEFATLGCSVESWLGPGNRASKSGTSVATPIAAGIAAMTIDYMRAKRDRYLDHTVSEHNHDPATRQSVRNWQAASYDDNLRRLGLCGGMSAVFSLMAGRSRDGYQYIRPWSVLHNRYTHPSALIHKIGSAVDHRNR